MGGKVVNQISYFKVRKAIEQWLMDNKTMFKNNNILVDEVNKTREQLFIILNFQKCLSAIVVAKDTFAPYRYVSFEMGDIVDGIHKMIYSWYDNENTTINEIVRSLDESIEFALNYNSSLL